MKKKLYLTSLIVVTLFTVLSSPFLALPRFSVSNNVMDQQIVSIKVKCCPHGVAFDRVNKYVYATDAASNGVVSVINGTSSMVVANISVGSSPEAIAVDSQSGNLYVSNPYSGTISVISGTTNKVVAVIPLGSFPTAEVFDPTNGYIYVANPSIGCSGVFLAPDNVSVIDSSTNLVVANISVGAGPKGIAYDSWNRDIYVANGCWGGISVIDGSTNKVIASIESSNFTSLNDLAFDSLNGCLYATGYSNVYVINGSTDSVVASVGTYYPWDVAVDLSNGYVYVTNQDHNPDNISVINPSSNTVVGNVTVQSGAYGIAFDSQNGNLYVANSGSGTISVIGSEYYPTTTAVITSSTSPTITEDTSNPFRAEFFTVPVNTPSGGEALIGISGSDNISSNQISNMVLSENGTTNQFSLSFDMSTANPSPLTIAVPDAAVPQGYSPLVYVDGKQASSQSYYTNQGSYYVTFSISGSNSQQQVSVAFSGGAGSSESIIYVSTTNPDNSPQTSFETVVAAIAGVLLVASGSAFAVVRRSKRS